jgi:tight adherence protein B
VLSALAAALAAVLMIGPRHRPLPQSASISRGADRAAWLRLFDGRVAGVTAGLVAAASGFAVGGALVAVAGWLIAVSAVRSVRLRHAERRASGRQAATETLLDALAAELGSGAAPPDAVAAVLHDLPPGLRAEVDQVRWALRSGADATAAWREVRGITQADALAAGFRVCEDTGASLASVLTRVAAMAADERRRRDEIGVALAGPRSSGVLLAALPALGVVAGAGLGASPLPFLFLTPIGHVCFVLGVGLDVLGVRWVARLAASAGRPPRLP